MLGRSSLLIRKEETSRKSSDLGQNPTTMHAKTDPTSSTTHAPLSPILAPTSPNAMKVRFFLSNSNNRLDLERQTNKDKTLKLLYKSWCNNQQALGLARAQQALLLDALIGAGVEDPIAVITARWARNDSLSKNRLATKTIAH